MKLSDWQNGVPPCDGVWQIAVPEHFGENSGGIYYARFKGGKWDSGYWDLKNVPSVFLSYPSNNNPNSPRKWRGIVDE